MALRLDPQVKTALAALTEALGETQEPPGENLPVLRTSATMFHISSACAAIGTVTDACICDLLCEALSLTVRVTDWSGQDYEKVSSLQRAMVEQATAHLVLAEDDWVIDVGCGDGFLTRQIAAMVPGGFAVGVDASQRMVATAHAAGEPAGSGPFFVVADVRALPFGTQFDVAVSFNALHCPSSNGHWPRSPLRCGPPVEL